MEITRHRMFYGIKDKNKTALGINWKQRLKHRHVVSPPLFHCLDSGFPLIFWSTWWKPLWTWPMMCHEKKDQTSRWVSSPNSLRRESALLRPSELTLHPNDSASAYHFSLLLFPHQFLKDNDKETWAKFSYLYNYFEHCHWIRYFWTPFICSDHNPVG